MNEIEQTNLSNATEIAYIRKVCQIEYTEKKELSTFFHEGTQVFIKFSFARDCLRSRREPDLTVQVKLLLDRIAEGLYTADN